MEPEGWDPACWEAVREARWPEGFVCLTVHPGWVQTRMGGGAAPMTLEESVSQLLATTFGAGEADNGTFRGPGNELLPW